MGRKRRPVTPEQLAALKAKLMPFWRPEDTEATFSLRAGRDEKTIRAWLSGERAPQDDDAVAEVVDNLQFAEELLAQRAERKAGQSRERQKAAPSNTSFEALERSVAVGSDPAERPAAPPVGRMEAGVSDDYVMERAARMLIGDDPDRLTRWQQEALRLAEKIGREYPQPTETENTS